MKTALWAVFYFSGQLSLSDSPVCSCCTWQLQSQGMSMLTCLYPFIFMYVPKFVSKNNPTNFHKARLYTFGLVEFRSTKKMLFLC